MQKLCVLFDKMKRSVYLYDTVNGETMKLYDYVQVVTLRGLFSLEINNLIVKWPKKNYIRKKWCFFYCGNSKWHNQLKITTSQTWVVNTANNQKGLANVPHLIELLRNHFVGNGFILNGTGIDKTIIEKQKPKYSS